MTKHRTEEDQLVDTAVTILDKVTVVPPLAEPEPGNSAEQLSDTMNASVDRAAEHIISKLDGLINEIQNIKERILKDADIIKKRQSAHFRLGAEALAFADNVVNRLSFIIHGED